MTVAEHLERGADLATGWLLLAFLDELRNGLTPATVGGRALVVLRDGDRIRVADATCPHRGAHLGWGGTVVDGGIRCPFHGRIVGIGEDGRSGHRVRQYATAQVGDLVFVLLDERRDTGLRELLDTLAATHVFVSGFVLPARVGADYVIENVFDAEHFETVHGISRQPRLQVRTGPGGGLLVEGALETPLAATRFCAHVISPGLVVTELGPAEQPNVVITGATPAPGGCVIRVAVAVPPDPSGGVPEAQVAQLLEDSQTAFRQDLLVWEHLVPGAPQNFDERDGTVVAYRRFCAAFGDCDPA
jgi:3-ketosteroid 9alpha-monooxygenase subunit A